MQIVWVYTGGGWGVGGAKIVTAKLVNDVSYCYCLACCGQSLRTDETIRSLYTTVCQNAYLACSLHNYFDIS